MANKSKLGFSGKKYMNAENEKNNLIEKLISRDKLDEAIDLALSSPFPQIAIHHLIDKLLQANLEMNKS